MVMAAGVGSRLEPLTQNIPKPLVPVLNKPVMDILLQKLKSYGIEKVIANTHYLAQQIEDRYTENSPVDIDFSFIRETDLSGTAGGVKKCESFFEGEKDFLVVSADGCMTRIWKKLCALTKNPAALQQWQSLLLSTTKCQNTGWLCLPPCTECSSFRKNPL